MHKYSIGPLLLIAAIFLSTGNDPAAFKRKQHFSEPENAGLKLPANFSAVAFADSVARSFRKKKGNGIC